MVGNTGKLTISSLAMLNAGKIAGNTSVDDFNMREKQITTKDKKWFIYIYICVCVCVCIYRLLFGSSDHLRGNVFHPVPEMVLIRSL